DGIRDGHVTGVQTCALPIYIDQHKIRPIRPEDLIKPQQPVPEEVTEEDDAGKKDKKRAIPGREQRQKERNERAEKRKTAKTGTVEIVDGKIIEHEVETHHKSRSSRYKLKHKQLIKQRATKLELESPVTIRILSEEMGIRW